MHPSSSNMIGRRSTVPINTNIATNNTYIQPSPSPTNIQAIDAHVDDGSDDGDGREDDDDDGDSDGGDIDEDDGDNGVNVSSDDDDDELIDDDAILRARVLQQKSTGGSSVAAFSGGELLQSSPSLLNLDGSRRIWLCPSRYGRPSTVYFDYPLAFDMQRNQEKVLCDKSCVLRYLHADSACIYNSITGTLKRAGFIEQTGTSKKEGAQWNVRWGKHMMPDALKELRSYQKINHFPGTGGIGRKDRLARNLTKSKRTHGPVEYNFLPETYLLPADRSLWEMKFAAEPPGTLWISKPNSSSCGRGIKMVSKISDIPVNRSCIVSRYIANPLLVNQRKFDLRIYVLVTSFHPLKVYLYQNGLARFCTEAYDLSKKNLKKKYIHLTNFSVNKRSAKFVKNTNDQNLNAGIDGGDSSKWSLQAFKKYLLTQYPAERCAQVWAQVNDIFIKTFLSIETHVSSNISRLGSHRDQCFELYGFDILLDSNLKPYLMEVNCAPSLSSSSPLDKRIKNELLTDTFHTVGIKPAYLKDKEDKKKKKSKSKTKSSPSESISRPASSLPRSGEVRSGGTMGPSNSKTSRSAMSPASATSSNSPLSPTSSSSSNNPLSQTDGGTRITKLKSTPVHIYFSHLCKSDLNLLREFRDEITRAHSGSWRIIFPLGVIPTTPLLPQQPASIDTYSHLFEVEKYDTLLLMKFQKHFADDVQERICQSGGRIEPWEVLHADKQNIGASPPPPNPRRASGPLSPTNATKPSLLRPATVSVATANISGSNQPSHHTRVQSATPATLSSSVASAHGSTQNRAATSRHIVATSESELNRALLASDKLHTTASAGPGSARNRKQPTQAFINEEGIETHSRPSTATATLSPSTRKSKPPPLATDEADTIVVPSHSINPFTLVDSSSSPDDSETDEIGRPTRRYFHDRGVTLQPYLQNAPQYHEGWSSQVEEAMRQQMAQFNLNRISPNSNSRASRPLSAARAHAIKVKDEQAQVAIKSVQPTAVTEPIIDANSILSKIRTSPHQPPPSQPIIPTTHHSSTRTSSRPKSSSRHSSSMFVMDAEHPPLYQPAAAAASTVPGYPFTRPLTSTIEGIRHLSATHHQTNHHHHSHANQPVVGRHLDCGTSGRPIAITGTAEDFTQPTLLQRSTNHRTGSSGQPHSFLTSSTFGIGSGSRASSSHISGSIRSNPPAQMIRAAPITQFSSASISLSSTSSSSLPYGSSLGDGLIQGNSITLNGGRLGLKGNKLRQADW